MNVAVCVKQIPEPSTPGRLSDVDYTLIRDGKIVLDEADSYGVEVALRLVEAAGSGEVVVISMAPGSETSGVRTALAMGASRAIVISDPELAGSDSLSTAKVLAGAISRISADLIITATESTDGYTGTVPVQIAELLGMPAVTYAKKVEMLDGRLVVERQTEGGRDEVSCELPAVLSVTAGVVEPRYPSFKGIMSAKSKPVEVLTVADLGLDPQSVGWTGARQKITSVSEAPGRAAGEVVHDEGDAEQRILALLEELKII